MKKMNTLLFHQGGKCFYCDALLALEEATIDHVIPQSKGGSNNIDNLVVCCKHANHAFADYSPKHKMAVIKQLCCFPSICQKIFPREKGITAPKSEEKNQPKDNQTEPPVRNQSVSVESNAAAIKTVGAAPVQKGALTTTKSTSAAVQNSVSTKTKSTSAVPVQNSASTAPAPAVTKNKNTNNSKTAKKPDISTAYQILLQAIDFFEEQGKEAISSQIKSQMLRLMPSFKQSDYGLGQFNKFLLRAQEDQMITLKNLQRAGNYIVKKKV